MKQVYIRIYGLVQGVALRYLTQEKAKDLALVGYVRNMSNGSVEIRAYGKEESVEEFINWLKSSPGSSQITDLKIKREKPDNSFKEFQILY